MNQKHSNDTEIIWKETRLAEIGRIVAGGTPSTSNPYNWNGSVAWVTPADLSGLRSRHLTTTERTLTELGLANSAARLLPPRSLVISSRAPIGHMALPLVSFCTNQGCKTIEFFDGQDPDFHYYNLRFWVRRLHDKGEGTTFSEISKKALEAVEVPVPSNRKVQETIASVLALLDRAIEQTEALLAKQQRIKTGLMHDLLTRGLDAQGCLRDPSTHRFKPTIFGLIPDQWNIVETARIVEVIDPQPDHRTPPTQPGGCPYIGIGDITSSGAINIEAARKVVPSALTAQCEAFSIHPGAFIFGKIGTLGMPTRIPCVRDFAISANVVLFTSPRQEDIDYVFWIYSSVLVDSQLADAANSTSQPALGIKSIRAIRIPWPASPEERSAISSMLEAADRSQRSTEANLSKLRRLKVGLMDDLLTGRVPVTPLLANPKAGISS